MQLVFVVQNNISIFDPPVQKRGVFAEQKEFLSPSPLKRCGKPRFY
jgi:hypothetical protein